MLGKYEIKASYNGKAERRRETNVSDFIDLMKQLERLGAEVYRDVMADEGLPELADGNESLINVYITMEFNRIGEWDDGQ